jgi:2-phospho-L-lactate guanylyltransferase
MTRWLLAPVKPLAEAKSRLASVLPAEARVAIMRSLLGRMLELAAATRLFDELLVISRDPRVWEMAQQAGAHALPEAGEDLNSALVQGRRHAQGAGVHSLLVLPADLPRVTAQDLHELCRLGEQADGLVIAPSYNGGTNALHLRLPSALPFHFGDDSFARHLAAAAAAGLAAAVYDSPTLRFDLDTPADLLALNSPLQQRAQ